MKRIVFISLVFVLLLGCQKEEICNPTFFDQPIMGLAWQDPICPGAFENNPTGMEETIHLGNQFSSPAFNPSNPYEFCYYQIVADSGSQIEIDHQIVIFNLQTGEKSIVLNHTKVVGNLAWNKKGWIAYQNENDGSIYAVHNQSHEIIQMSGVEGFPIDKNLAWINNQDTLIWGGADVNMVSYLKFNTIDSGEEEEILVYGEPAAINNEFAISSKNELLARGQNSLNSGCEFYKVDFDKILTSWNSFTILLNGSKFGRVNWHVDGNKFYVPMTGSLETAGLFEVNYKTLAINKLYNFCDQQFIYQAVCSPNGKYLLIQKIEREYLIDPNSPDDFPWGIDDQIVENSNLWLYDLKMGKEAELPLD